MASYLNLKQKMKKIIGLILVVAILVFAYRYVSNFLCECEVKCKNCATTSPNLQFSKESGFYIGTYTPSSDTIQLKNYNEQIVISAVWAEKSWFRNTDDCESPKLEKTEGYNVVIEFSKTKKEFIFDLMPLTTDKLGIKSYGINETKKEMQFANLPNEIKIIVEERNPDDTIGWTKSVVTDTIVLSRKRSKLFTNSNTHQ